MYTEEQIKELLRIAKDAELSAPLNFFSATIPELQTACNGVGADWMSERSRKILTKILSCAETSAAIHDWRYYNSDGSDRVQKYSDEEFRTNALKEVDYKFKWYDLRRYIARWRVLAAYDVLARLGVASWCISFRDRIIKERN